MLEEGGSDLRGGLRGSARDTASRGGHQGGQRLGKLASAGLSTRSVEGRAVQPASALLFCSLNTPSPIYLSEHPRHLAHLSSLSVPASHGGLSRDKGEKGQEPQSHQGPPAAAAPALLTLLPVTVIQAIGVSVQHDPASTLSRDLIQPQNGDVFNYRCFLL